MDKRTRQSDLCSHMRCEVEKGEVLVYDKAIRFWGGLHSPQLWTVAQSVGRVSPDAVMYPFWLMEGGCAGM